MKDKIILGFNGGHEGSAALIINGRVVAAIDKERITREKKDNNGNSKELITFLLNLFDLKINDVDYITFCDNFKYGDNYIKFYKDDKLQEILFSQDLKKPLLQAEARVEGISIPAFQVHHHLSHSSYGFYTSKFEKAVCLSVDSSYGEPHAYSHICLGADNNIHLLRCPDIKVGNLYGYCSSRMGYGHSLFKAGAIMGLASYGKPSEEVKKNWKKYTGGDYEKTWYELSGLNEGKIIIDPDTNFNKVKNIAADLQYIFEQEILTHVKNIYAETKEFHEDNICLSGGSFLNCNLNHLIKEKSPFKNISISPACGDNGLAIGSALYLAHHVLGLERQEYTNAEIAYLGASYKKPPSIGKKYDVKEVANLLKQNKIIALYQGRSEFGPRALGNRSLLANPTIIKNKHFINTKIKNREWFRPFAPSILKEKVNEWFDFKGESPFMLFTVHAKKPDLIPAAVHVDNTSRIQTVSKEDNPRFYDLIKEFEKLTGVPMLLNTSLNLGGEPLVETPKDALQLLAKKDIYALILENSIIYKKDLNQLLK